MPISPGLAIFKTLFELSPIFLTGKGAAEFVPFNVLPLLTLTEALNLPVALITGAENIELDAFFAHYVPIPGGTLFDNAASEYPFANQAVAANALIQNPLQIALRMICPVRETLGYATKLATMMLVQKTLDYHNNNGGTYTVATPSYFYTNLIMTGMRDISGSDSKQAQHTWQLEFRQPLLTLEAAQAAQNGLMSKITGGTQVNGTPAWSGVDSSIGQSSPISTGTPVQGVTVENLPATGTPGPSFNSPLAPNYPTP